MVVMETATVLGAVPEAGVAESQLELRALTADQFRVPPPVLVICKFCPEGRGPDCTAVKLKAVGEREMTGEGGGVDTV